MRSTLDHIAVTTDFLRCLYTVSHNTSHLKYKVHQGGIWITDEITSLKFKHELKTIFLFFYVRSDDPIVDYREDIEKCWEMIMPLLYKLESLSWVLESKTIKNLHECVNEFNELISWQGTPSSEQWYAIEKSLFDLYFDPTDEELWFLNELESRGVKSSRADFIDFEQIGEL